MAANTMNLDVDNFIAFAEELLSRCKNFKQIEGSQKLERKIVSEIKFLKTMEVVDDKMSHMFNLEEDIQSCEASNSDFLDTDDNDVTRKKLPNLETAQKSVVPSKNTTNIQVGSKKTVESDQQIKSIFAIPSTSTSSPEMRKSKRDSSDSTSDDESFTNAANKCPVCNKLFHRKYDFRYHLTSHERIENYVNVTPNLSESFEHTHLTMNSGSDGASSVNVKGAEVSKKVVDSDAEKSLLQLNSDNSTFTLPTCHVCNKTFKRLNGLFIHLKSHSFDKKCNICDEVFRKEKEYKIHMRIHSISNFKCKICLKPCSDKYQLKRHTITHTQIKVKRDRVDLECEICGRVFHAPNVMALHMKSHKRGSKDCHLCGDSFNRPFKKLKHIDSVHKNKDGHWYCKPCDIPFENDTLLKAHNDASQCLVKTKVVGIKRKKTRISEAKYVCSICNKRYKSRNSLKYHYLLHTGEMPCICDVCGVSFRDKYSLSTHFLVHTQEKKHFCEYCGKKFSLQASLIRHVRIHTKEKPYICNVCGWRCSNPSSLKAHEWVHFSEEERQRLLKQCCICLRSFRNINQHLKTHLKDVDNKSEAYAQMVSLMASNSNRFYPKRNSDMSPKVTARDFQTKKPRQRIMTNNQKNQSSSNRNFTNLLDTNPCVLENLNGQILFTDNQHSNEETDEIDIGFPEVLPQLPHKQSPISSLANATDDNRDHDASLVVAENIGEHPCDDDADHDYFDDVVDDDDSDVMHGDANLTVNFADSSKKIFTNDNDTKVKVEFINDKDQFGKLDLILSKSKYTSNLELKIDNPKTVSSSSQSNSNIIKMDPHDQPIDLRSDKKLALKASDFNSSLNQKHKSHLKEKIKNNHNILSIIGNPTNLGNDITTPQGSSSDPIPDTFSDSSEDETSETIVGGALKKLDAILENCDSMSDEETLSKKRKKKSAKNQNKKRKLAQEIASTSDQADLNYDQVTKNGSKKKTRKGVPRKVKQVRTNAEKEEEEEEVVDANKSDQEPEPSLLKFKCTTCGKSYKTNASLQKHKYAQGHLEEDEKKLWRKLENNSYQCTVCELICSSKYFMLGHCRIHNDDVSPYDCTICGRKFHMSSGLSKHMVSHTGIKRFKCDICDKAFTVSENLVRHKKYHCVGNPETTACICHICGKCCKSIGILERHMTSHNPEYKSCLTSRQLKSQCPNCGIFVYELKEHMKTHSSTRDFSCAICGKAFYTEKVRNKHQKNHSGLKPFVCSFHNCGKAFSERAFLNRHTKTHNSSHQCMECPAVFSKPDQFVKHMILHNSDKKFTCEVCNRPFDKANKLPVHVRVHTGEKPFSCEHCHKSFTQYSVLTRHMKEQHLAV